MMVTALCEGAVRNHVTVPVTVGEASTAASEKSAPHVSHAPRRSQKMERQTEHTKPTLTGRL